MQTIREQYDLALLPEPRFIPVVPAWLRRFMTAFFVAGALFGGAVFATMISNGDNLPGAFGGAIAVAACLLALVHGRPGDWRAWVNLAATPDGLYLVAHARRVVFVPWPDVLDIGVEPIANRYFARLTLRLPEEAWSQFGSLSSIKGTGAVRRYLLSALTMPGDKLAAELQDFRAANGG
jgi:hypothetical protein